MPPPLPPPLPPSSTLISEQDLVALTGLSGDGLLWLIQALFSGSLWMLAEYLDLNYSPAANAAEDEDEKDEDEDGDLHGDLHGDLYGRLDGLAYDAEGG
jgi:hypothetical protein